MRIKEKLASLGKKMNVDKAKSTTNVEKSQTFIVIAYRDQELCIYLAEYSPKQFTVLNFINLKIPSLVIGEDQVLRTNELAEIISDAIEVFAFENKIGSSLNEIPAIVLLEPSKFDIDCINLRETERYSEAISQIDDQAMYKIFEKSPFIQDDTSFEIFTIAEEFYKLNKINIMYSSKKFLKSWSNVVEAVGVKTAYIGSASSPLLMDLAESNNCPCILLDMQKLNSKIYCINGKKDPIIIELKLPYGYMQFTSGGNSFSYERLKARIMATIKQQDVPSLFSEAKVFIFGNPDSTQPTNLKAENIEKVSAKTLKIEQKRIRVKKEFDEVVQGLHRDFMLNIESLCKRLF